MAYRPTKAGEQAVRAANRAVRAAVRHAEKQANFEKLFRQIERDRKRAAAESEARRSAAVRFAALPARGTRERQQQLSRLLGRIEKHRAEQHAERLAAFAEKKSAEAEAEAEAGAEQEFPGGFEAPEYDEYESHVSYKSKRGR